MSVLPVTFTNGSGVNDNDVQTSLGVSAADPSAASQIGVNWDGAAVHLPPVPSLAPGQADSDRHIHRDGACDRTVGE